MSEEVNAKVLNIVTAWETARGNIMRAEKVMANLAERRFSLPPDPTKFLMKFVEAHDAHTRTLISLLTLHHGEVFVASLAESTIRSGYVYEEFLKETCMTPTWTPLQMESFRELLVNMNKFVRTGE
jgi:hypothetical protein